MQILFIGEKLFYGQIVNLKSFLCIFWRVEGSLFVKVYIVLFNSIAAALRAKGSDNNNEIKGNIMQL